MVLVSLCSILDRLVVGCEKDLVNIRHVILKGVRSQATSRIQVIAKSAQRHVLNKVLYLVVGNVIEGVVGGDGVPGETIGEVEEVLALVATEGHAPVFFL